MPLQPDEHRTVRRAADGGLYQWSNASTQPAGTGWIQASKAQFPRVRSYLWFRPASYIKQDQEAHVKAVEEIRRPGLTGIFKFNNFMKLYSDYFDRKTVQHDFKKGNRVNLDGSVYYV